MKKILLAIVFALAFSYPLPARADNCIVLEIGGSVYVLCL
jgi:hypothetical protein